MGGVYYGKVRVKVKVIILPSDRMGWGGGGEGEVGGGRCLDDVEMGGLYPLGFLWGGRWVGGFFAESGHSGRPG